MPFTFHQSPTNQPTGKVICSYLYYNFYNSSDFMNFTRRLSTVDRDALPNVFLFPDLQFEHCNKFSPKVH